MTFQQMYRDIAEDIRIQGSAFTSESNYGVAGIEYLDRFIYQAYHLGWNGTIDLGQLGDRAQQLTIPELVDPQVAALVEDVFGNHRFLDDHWRLLSGHLDEAGAVVVEKRGVHLRVPKDLIQRCEDGSTAIWMPRVSLFASPGWATIHPAAMTVEANDPKTRLYLAMATPTDLVHSARRLAEHLDAEGVPYALKFGTTPEHLTRPDSIVAFILRPFWTDALETSIAGLSLPLADSCPGFARAIAPGIATGDEPPAQSPMMSLGQHRSRIVAGALRAAPEGASASTKYRHILAGLCEAGVDPDAPYRWPASEERG